MRLNAIFKQQEKLVADWNRANAVGANVIVTKDDGTEFPTITKTQAQLMGGHSAVIWLEGISGAYSLDRVRIANEKSSESAGQKTES